MFYYLIVNGFVGAAWLRTVYVYFARRPQLHKAYQTMPSRRRDLVALATVALGVTGFAPLFTEWLSVIEKLIGLVLLLLAAAVAFFSVRMFGENASHKARRKVSREAERAAAHRLAAAGE